MELKPFLCRPPLLPDETLASYIYRVALANGHSPNIVNQLFSEKLHERESVVRSKRSETYNMLARLLGLPPYKIYWASLNGYASLVVSQDKEVKTITFDNGLTFSLYPVDWWFPTHFNYENELQYCPYCLSKAQYQRRIWQPKVVSACIEHQCLLMNRCPHCEKKISIQNLITGTCTRCKKSLTEAGCVDLSTDVPGLETQKIIYYWFNGGPYEWSTLPRVPERDIYDVFYTFMDMILWDTKSMYRLHSVPGCKETPTSLEKRYVAAATAMQAFLNWPNGFTDFMDRYAYRNGKAPTLRARQHFMYLFHNGVLDKWATNEAYQFIYEMVVEYFTSNTTFSHLHRYQHFKSNPVPFSKFAWLTEKEMAKELGVASKLARRLIASKIISGQEWREKFSKQYFLRKNVVALKKRWRHSVPLPHAAIWLGLSEDTLIDLVAEDLLEVVDGNPNRGISRASLEEFQNTINRIVKRKYRWYKDAVNLAKAANILSSYDFNQAKVIHMVVQHKLACHYGYTDALDDLKFSASSLVRLVETLYPRSLLYSFDIARRKRVDRDVVKGWVDLGLISPRLKIYAGDYFDKKDAYEFDSMFVVMKEAAIIADVLPTTIQDWMRRDLLTPIPGTDAGEGKGTLFRRKDLEKFAPENRLSLEHLSSEIGVEDNQVRQLMKEKKIRPITGAKTDGDLPPFFLRSEVETFLPEYNAER